MNIGSVVGKVVKTIGTTGGFANDVGQKVLGQVAVGLQAGTLPLKNAAAAISRMLGASPESVRQAADAATRLQYVHILEQALEKAQRPGGNTQTQVNDLTVRLRNLARESQEASSMTQQQVQQEMQNLMQKQQQVFQTLSNIMKKQQEVTKGVIQNIR